MPGSSTPLPKSVEGMGLNRTAELTDVYAVVVPVCPGHVLVDISVDARHGRGADGYMRSVSQVLDREDG
jgi:hypothetical protein